MENDKNFEHYFYIKLIQGILFNEKMYNDFLNHKYDEYTKNIKFVDMFADYVDMCIQSQLLESEEKQRVYTIISRIRNFISDDDLEFKNSCIKMYNRIIKSLNSFINVTNNRFYLNEINKRYGLKNSSERYINKFKTFIKRSIGFDFPILMFHLNELDEQSFLEKANELIMNEYYFASVNAIIHEYPEILKNKTFIERLKKIIMLNKKNAAMLLEKSFDDKLFVLRSNASYEKRFL